MELIAYVLGCALVPAGLVAYLVWHHALAAAFDDVIRWTATHYAPVNIVPFGRGATIRIIPSFAFSRSRPC